jgi:AcrR family transcriptional regulator
MKPRRPPPRHRKTSEQAREDILDAAERRLLDAGPGSIRLQEVAADVDVSHPAVLHHFGSREGLVQAVVARAVGRLQADLLETLGSIGTAPDGPDALLDRVFEVLSRRGQGRLMAWLLLSGHDPFASEATRAGWASIMKATHELRPKARRGARGAPGYDDTRFTVILSALALFGDAVAGESTFRVAGFVDPERAGASFRRWLAALLARHLESAVVRSDATGSTPSPRP